MTDADRAGRGPAQPLVAAGVCSRRAALLQGGSFMLLAGCGGGDGGGSAAPPPVAAPAPTPVPSATPTPTLPPPRYNLAVATESWASAAFQRENGAIISSTSVQDVAVDGRTVRLRQITLPDPASLIRYTPGMPRFVAGRTYLLSFYVRSATGGETFAWARQVAPGARGHEPKLLGPAVRRVWTRLRALSATDLAPLSDPIAGAQAGQGLPVVLCRGSHAAGPITLFAGGLQIEEVAEARQGIAVIGDSTQNNDSNMFDNQGASTPARWLAGATNLPVFNRAVSGNTIAQMVGRWNVDMAPLAANASWAVIQGGINDVRRGVGLATIQSGMNQLVALAERDGMRPVLCTASPNQLADVAQRPVRDQLNSWIRATFPRVIDIDAALRDAGDAQRLAPAYTIDGTHYSDAGNRAAGLFMADQPWWARGEPAPYEPVA